MQIVVDKDAAQYIRKRTGAVVIAQEFEPSLGGCACSSSRLSGSYLPVISLGRPAPDEADRYQSQVIDAIEVFAPPGLNLKQGSEAIRIKLKGFLAFHWLEIEGAKGIACLVD